MNKYYLHKGSGQLGPFSLDELKAQAIDRDALVWCEGMPEWQKAGDVEELKPLLTQIPPPLSARPASTPPPPVTPSTPSAKKGWKPGWRFYTVLALLLIAGGILMFNKLKDEAVEEVIIQQEINQSQEKYAKEAEAENEKNKRKKYIRNNIFSFIEYKCNYDVGVLGGLSNVQVHFYNNCEFPIDEVVIRVTYIKDNGGAAYKEDVTLSNIAAKGNAVEVAGSSARGSRVEMEIISMRSNALSLCFYGVSPGDDPYLCL